MNTTELSGRELNIAVAERVFGIKPRNIRVRGSTETVTVYTNNPFFQDGMWEGEYLRQHSASQRYSSDIREAFRVVDELAKRDLRMTLYSPGGFMEDGQSRHETMWTAVFTDGRYSSTGCANGESAAEAICRAAVNATAAMEGK